MKNVATLYYEWLTKVDPLIEILQRTAAIGRIMAGG